MQEQFLKVKEVAELLQLSPRQILNLCKEDANTPMPHLRVGRHSIRFRRSARSRENVRSSCATAETRPCTPCCRMVSVPSAKPLARF